MSLGVCCKGSKEIGLQLAEKVGIKIPYFRLSKVTVLVCRCERSRDLGQKRIGDRGQRAGQSPWAATGEAVLASLCQGPISRWERARRKDVWAQT